MDSNFDVDNISIESFMTAVNYLIYIYNFYVYLEDIFKYDMYRLVENIEKIKKSRPKPPLNTPGNPAESGEVTIPKQSHLIRKRVAVADIAPVGRARRVARGRKERRLLRGGHRRERDAEVVEPVDVILRAARRLHHGRAVPALDTAVDDRDRRHPLVDDGVCRLVDDDVDLLVARHNAVARVGKGRVGRRVDSEQRLVN